MSATLETSDLSPAEIDAVLELLSALQSTGGESTAHLTLGSTRLPLPGSALRLVTEVMEGLAKGHSVTIVTDDEKEISPQAAAGLLGVSRPYASKLFDDGSIPSRRVGTHRRAFLRDVLAYRERQREARKCVLADLAAESQRLGLGY